MARRVKPLVYNHVDNYYRLGAHSGGSAGYRKAYNLGKTGPAPPLISFPITGLGFLKLPILLFSCSKMDYNKHNAGAADARSVPQWA